MAQETQNKYRTTSLSKWKRAKPFKAKKQVRKKNLSPGRCLNCEVKVKRVTNNILVRRYDKKGRAGVTHTFKYSPYYCPHLFYSTKQSHRGLDMLRCTTRYARLRMPEDVIDQIHELASLTKVNKSRFVRDAMIWYCSLIEAKLFEGDL